MPRSSTHIALLRAVNVGGTGKLPMVDLQAMAQALGYERVRTYIASGNLLLDSPADPATVRRQLEERLAAYAGKPVGVVMCDAAALDALLAANPFPDAAPNRVVAILLNDPVPPQALTEIRHQRDEQVVLGERVIYVHYGQGMADSRLRIPAGEVGTGRNLNTLRKLLAMASDP